MEVNQKKRGRPVGSRNKPKVELTKRKDGSVCINVKFEKQIENMLLQCFVPISKEELAGRFPEISVTTVERVLGKMIREGKIEKIGTYRDARYRRV